MLSAVGDAIDLGSDRGKILRIPPETYRDIFNIVAAGRVYCGSNDVNKDNYSTDEHLVCYGYLGMLNSSNGVLILSDDRHVPHLLKYSGPSVGEVLGEKVLGLKSRSF